MEFFVPSCTLFVIKRYTWFFTIFQRIHSSFKIKMKNVMIQITRLPVVSTFKVVQQSVIIVCVGCKPCQNDVGILNTYITILHCIQTNEGESKTQFITIMYCLTVFFCFVFLQQNYVFCNTITSGPIVLQP